MKRKRFKVTIKKTIMVDAPSEDWVNVWLEARDERAAGGVFRDEVPYHTDSAGEEEDYPEIEETTDKPRALDMKGAKEFTENAMYVKLTDEEFAIEDPDEFGQMVADRQYEEREED